MLNPDALRWKPTGRTERCLYRNQKLQAPLLGCSNRWRTGGGPLWVTQENCRALMNVQCAHLMQTFGLLRRCAKSEPISAMTS